jgi:hypothetical protein
VSLDRILKILALLAFAVAGGLAMHRFRKSPEQADLERYVQSEVPKLLYSEQPIQERVDRLGRAPGLRPEEARALLIDDIIPRLLRLRRQAEALQMTTRSSRTLNDEYLAITDQLIDACRTCVRIIDDPKLPQAVGLGQVRARFAEVRRAYATWNQHVRDACVHHGLVPPQPRGESGGTTPP